MPHRPAIPLDIPRRDYAGYIFDCDGTLVDSMPLHFRAWSAAFVANDASFEFTEEHFYKNAGVPDRTIVEGLNEQYATSLDPEAVHDFKKDWFVQHLSELESVPEVAAVVRELFGKKPIAVATGSDLAIVDPELTHVELRKYFEVIVTPADVEHGKPAPDMFLLAAERLGVPPAECLVFEDGQAGIEAANAAGMDSVFVASAPQLG
jgi:beta-phosphoglucomutase family hydrolase